MAGETNFYTIMVEANGDIHEMSGYQKGRKLGIDIRQEAKLYEENQNLSNTIAELTEVLESWRPIMIETGHIVVPKTPEEIAQEAAQEQMRALQARDAQQAEINKVLIESIQGLKNTIEELTRREHDGSGVAILVEPSPKKQSQNSQNSRKKPAASRVSAKAGASNVASGDQAGN